MRAEEAGVLPTHIPREVPQEPPSLVGAKAGSFRLLRELGRGGMGTVYLGEHELIGSRVAVKVLHPHLAAHPQVIERFFAEARAVNLIGHENIVRIFDMSQMATGEWFLVMELLCGQPLSTFAQKALAERTTLQLLIQILDALEAAHGREIVHRDVKPENVFVVPRADGALSAKLLDFGIARFFGALQPSTRTAAGTVLGTPAYMAPEQWNGGAVDARADLYAVGVLGWTLATGKNPFAGLSLTELMAAQRQCELPAADGRALSSGLRSALRRALCFAREDRFESAAAMREALSGLLDGARPAPAPEKAGTPGRYRVRVEAGGQAADVEAQSLSRAGAFICSREPLPPLRSEVSLTFHLPGGELFCRGEVVRHVPAAQASAWGMPEGFGVQFLGAGRDFGRNLELLLKDAGTGPREDLAAAQRLRKLACGLTGDHYSLLGVPRDAGFPELRRKARSMLDELAHLGRAPLSPDSRDRLQRLLEQTQAAARALEAPERRAAYDAERGNHRGVARCLAAGLAVSALEKLRSAWLSGSSRSASRAQLHRITAELYAGRGEEEAALAEFEKALELDPLLLDLHCAYATLQRRSADSAQAERRRAAS